MENLRSPSSSTKLLKLNQRITKLILNGLQLFNDYSEVQHVQCGINKESESSLKAKQRLGFDVPKYDLNSSFERSDDAVYKLVYTIVKVTCLLAMPDPNEKLVELKIPGRCLYCDRFVERMVIFYRQDNWCNLGCWMYSMLNFMGLFDSLEDNDACKKTLSEIIDTEGEDYMFASRLMRIEAVSICSRIGRVEELCKSIESLDSEEGKSGKARESIVDILIKDSESPLNRVHKYALIIILDILKECDFSLISLT